LIVIVDVAYSNDRARVGCVAISAFADAVPRAEWVVEVPGTGAYVPGEFWRRELAPVLAGIASAPVPVTLCVIDAYVDLGRQQTPGLGRHLFDATGVPALGVAKSRYPGTPTECEVLRGSSRRPLFVSAAGIDPASARQAVRDMAGVGRIPTVLRRADLLSRGAHPETA
jgi:deoxyribonuclease V